ncbi:MAG: TonB-dependent receptor [Saprospiraceae bacterium]|nr:TonB-dependent receptor [Candidatus Vicinibacter affinis]
MRKFALIGLWIFIIGQVCGQRDSVQLSEIMITATRTERLLSAVPMPFQMIPGKNIKAIGSTRLQDILGEQAGLIIVPQVNGLGNGLQIQGLNPDYTLILIDGEPLIGRYAGTLELSRITTGNIRKIEIVKGPSSSLYGSEALAGVINIITDQPLVDKLNAGVRYGLRNTLDLSAQGNVAREKWRLSLFGNRYSTDGYDLSPDIFGQTVSPFSNYTFQSRLVLNPTAHQEINLSAKYFQEDQHNEYQVLAGGDSIKVNGSGKVSDFSFNPFYKYSWNNQTHVIARVYSTYYRTSTELYKQEDGMLHYTDDFNQFFMRPELQATCRFLPHQKWTAGTGYILETVNTSRYGDDHKKKQDTYYGFLQHEWDPNVHFTLVSGLRFDHNSSYRSQWSPKLAAQFSFNSKHSIKASVGNGFKAPDFRQLYLNFNNAAAGYSVFGSDVVTKEIENLQAAGRIQQILSPLETMGHISPEQSFAINIGSQHQLNQFIKVDVNLFRNDLKGLIETIPVALTTDQRLIYSYTNIKKAFTQGIEINANYSGIKNLGIQLGYQYLEAKDKEVLNEVKKGLVYGRDPQTLESYRLKSSDYLGLSNRSRHNATLKFFYEFPKYGMDLNVRFVYRGAFGITNTAGNVSGVLIPSSDRNGNAILDSYDQLVKGYTLTNLTMGKKWRDRYKIQLVCENLFNYRDALHIPNLIGRNLFIHFQYQFIKS